ncbi:hypothetical protein [Acetobacterium sp.]|uniref:hypothetical protein n=1 Tax=Acetobacterium sp. TaxID=1872094 RepID=UPI002F411226
MKSKALSEYKKYTNLYFNRFGEGYPMMQYMDYPENVTKKIKRCLQENKKVEVLYPNKIPDDVDY